MLFGPRWFCEWVNLLPLQHVIINNGVKFACPQFNFLAVACGVSGVAADDRQELVHQLTSGGWREDGVMWHCTSECASNVYRTLSTINQTTSSECSADCLYIFDFSSVCVLYISMCVLCLSVHLYIYVVFECSSVYMCCVCVHLYICVVFECSSVCVCCV